MRKYTIFIIGLVLAVSVGSYFPAAVSSYPESHRHQQADKGQLELSGGNKGTQYLMCVKKADASKCNSPH